MEESEKAIRRVGVPDSNEMNRLEDSMKAQPIPPGMDV